MVRKVIQIGNSKLLTKSESVTFPLLPEHLNLIDDLIDTCLTYKDIGVGISAVQIGELVRICVLREIINDQKLGNKFTVIINPELLWKSDELSEIMEGCLSVGDGPTALYGNVKRPLKVKYKYYDIDGKLIERTVSGYESHMIQHEIDHMNGILFLAHISDPSQLRLAKDLHE